MSRNNPPYIGDSYEKFLEKQIINANKVIAKGEFAKAQKEVAMKKLEEYRESKKIEKETK